MRRRRTGSAMRKMRRDVEEGRKLGRLGRIVECTGGEGAGGQLFVQAPAGGPQQRARPPY